MRTAEVRYDADWTCLEEMCSRFGGVPCLGL